MKSIVLLSSFSAVALLLSSCGEKQDTPEESADSGATGTPAALEAVFVEAEPETSISVVEARKSAKPGDTLTISGKVAGAMSPFTEGFSTAVLADATLQTCDLIEGDECVTPWDACCVEQEVINSLRLSIQVLGEDGRPVTQSLAGVRGLKELDHLVVTGAVAEGSTAENLILNASEIYQKPAVPATGTPES